MITYRQANVFLVALILTTLSGLGLAVGLAQATLPKAKPTTTATPSPTPADPMTLTAEEVRDIEFLTAEMRPLYAEANSTYQKLLASKTSAERYTAADQHWIAAKQLEPLQQKQVEWLAAVRKAHNCPDCLVQGNKLVPPPNAIPQGK